MKRVSNSFHYVEVYTMTLIYKYIRRIALGCVIGSVIRHYAVNDADAYDDGCKSLGANKCSA